MLPLLVVSFAAAVPLLLRVCTISRVAWWITPSAGARPEPSRADVLRLVVYIDRWLVRSRPVVRRGCLTRGVTLYYFLRRAGAPVSLRFGIGLVDGAIGGHCWICYDGEPLAEPRDPRPIFSETWAMPLTS